MIRKNRTTAESDNYGSVNQELNDIQLETKHKQWLERRKFIFNFFIFLGLSLILVFASLLLTKRKDEDMKTLFKETIHNSNEMLHNMEKKLSDNIVSIKSLANEKYHMIEPAVQVVDNTQLKLEEKTQLQTKCNTMIEEIRGLKRSGVVIENDLTAQLKVQTLQACLQKLVPLMYGEEPYIVEMQLKFPESMPDYVSNGASGKLIFELGPLSLVPYSTYYYLDVISNFKVIKKYILMTVTTLLC